MKKVLFVLPLVIFFSCSNNDSTRIENDDQQSVATSIDFIALGDSLAINAQNILLSNVAGAIQEGGFAHAVEFCNSKALFLTDSLSTSEFNLSRISAKNRNESNAASKREHEILNGFTSEKQSVVIEQNGKHIYYKAIRIGMPTCLKCHGTNETIDTEAAKMIQRKYPNDKAIGYKKGDLRGAWKIVFDY